MSPTRLVSLLLLLPILIATSGAAHGESGPPQASADNSYEEQSVGIRNLAKHRRHEPAAAKTAGTNQGWALPGTPWDAFAGKDHHPIDEETFFQIVGRDDLVRRHRRTVIAKTSLFLGGWGLIVGGMVFTVATGLGGVAGVHRLGVSDSTSLTPLWGLAAVGAGIAALIVGHNLDPTPVDGRDADTLARDYDRSLRDRLGISESAARE